MHPDDGGVRDGNPVLALSEMETELEELMSEVDARQQEVDSLTSAIAERQAQITKLTRDSEIMRKAEQFRTREAHSSPNCAFDESRCNPEHIDFLQEKKNIIAELESSRTSLLSSTEVLEEDISLIQQEIATVTGECAKSSNLLHRSTSKRRKLEQECELARSQMKEYENQILAYQKIVRDADAARNGLKVRLEEIDAKTNGQSGLPSTIHNLESEILALELSIERLQEQISEMAAQRDTLNTELPAPEPGEPIWRQGIAEDLDTLRDDIQHAKEVLKRSLSSLRRLEARYQKMAPVAKRWRRAVERDADRLAQEIRVPVDDLLRSLARDGHSKVAQSAAQKKARLSELLAENGLKEAEVVKRRQELETRMALASTEQARVKEQIRVQRGDCSGKEEKIVAEIRKLKLKLAQKKVS